MADEYEQAEIYTDLRQQVLSLSKDQFDINTPVLAVLEDDLGNERHVLSPVFFQGHELISYIRAADEHRSAEQVAPTDH